MYKQVTLRFSCLTETYPHIPVSTLRVHFCSRTDLTDAVYWQTRYELAIIIEQPQIWFWHLWNLAHLYRTQLLNCGVWFVCINCMTQVFYSWPKPFTLFSPHFKMALFNLPSTLIKECEGDFPWQVMQSKCHLINTLHLTSSLPSTNALQNFTSHPWCQKIWYIELECWTLWQNKMFSNVQLATLFCLVSAIIGVVGTSKNQFQYFSQSQYRYRH